MKYWKLGIGKSVLYILCFMFCVLYIFCFYVAKWHCKFPSQNDILVLILLCFCDMCFRF